MFIVSAVQKIIQDAFRLAPRGTQTRVAKNLGVKQQTVSKWAAGDIVPEQWRWPAIERELDLDPGALMEAHYKAVRPPDDGSQIPEAVRVALQTLGDELAQLRAEVAALRAERPGSVQSSDPVPQGLPPTPRPQP